jgi:hypothetical protein
MVHQLTEDMEIVKQEPDFSSIGVEEASSHYVFF